MRTRAVRAVALLVIGSSALVVASRSDASGAVGGVRAAVRMPFSDGGTTGVQSPSGHPRFNGAGFAWDLHKGPGVEVKARIVSSDGAVSIRVLRVRPNPNGAGNQVDVQVKVNGTVVGTIFYSHIKSPQVTGGRDYGADQLLGWLADGTQSARQCRDGTSDGWPYSSNWQVCTPSGIHTHLDVQKGCYRSLGNSAGVARDTAVIMLSTAYGTTNRSACDNAELDAVNNDLARYAGYIVQWDRDTSTQRTAWLVGTDLKRRWIPDIATYDCLKAQGAPGPVALPASVLDRLTDLNGVWAECGHVLGASTSVPVTSPPATTPPVTSPPVTNPPVTTPATYTDQCVSRSGCPTFRNYVNASGVGPRIGSGAYVAITCKLRPASTIGSAHPDGYWYLIASSPWNNEFWAVANSFHNGGDGRSATNWSIRDC